MPMPKYLLRGDYTPEGLAGLLKDGGSARRSIVEKAAAELGGSIESFYFAFGDDDVFVVADLPDNTAAAKMALAVGSTGRVHITVVPLITVEEVDAIASGAEPSYTPPGS